MPTTLLHVAEKPSVAKSIANALCSPGKPRTAPGRGGGNGRQNAPPVYEFECETASYGRCNHIVTGVAGHLMNVDFAPPYNEWNSCNPIDLFDAPLLYAVPEDKKAMEAQLIALARRAQVLVLWLDCDREGEGIAYEVIEVCSKGNPRLTLRRAKFSATTERDIRNAMAALVNPDERMANAVKARSELDLRLGAAFTRLQTISLANRFNDLAGKTISYGPCQFPTLGFVVQRYLDISRFISEPFWEIRMGYLDAGSTAHTGMAPAEAGDASDSDGPMPPYTSGDPRITAFSWDRNRVYDEFTAVLFYEAALRGGHAEVVEVTGRPSSKVKPTPLNSVDFAMFSSRYLKMNSQNAAKIAEELYTKGYISYPRTETQIFDETIDVRKLVSDHVHHPVWGNHARSLVDGGGFEVPLRGKTHDKAHPPIHPLRPATQDEFQSFNHWRVYELVTRHFIACCSKNAIGRATKVVARLGDETFSASGLVVLERNFLDVYPYQKWSGRQLPAFHTGQQFVPHELILHKGETAPPQLLAEHELISIMNANGIGTDATIPEHVAKVQEREYMMKNEQGRFAPTTLGVGLLKGYDRLALEAMSKPFLRASVEQDLTKICEGLKSKDVVIRECLSSMRPVYQKTAQQLAVLIDALAELFEPLGTDQPVAQQSISRCGDCRGPMQLRRVVSDGDADAVLALFCGTCRRGYRMPRGTGNVSPVDFECPICNFQVVKAHLSSGPTSKMLCPKCFLEPPAAYSTYATTSGSAAVPPVGANTDCNHCSNVACKFAGNMLPRGAGSGDLRDQSPFGCALGTCSGWMIPRKTSQGAWLLSCSKQVSSSGGSRTGCQHTIWLPRYVVHMAVSPPAEQASTCTRCSVGSAKHRQVYKLDFAFAPGSVTPDMTNRVIRRVGETALTFRACIACERELVQGISEKPTALTAAQLRAAFAARTATEPSHTVPDVEDLIAPSVTMGIEPATNGTDNLGGRFLSAPAPKPSTQRKTTAAPPASAGTTMGSGESDPPVCKMHALPCVLRVSRSEKSSGREFWCCSQEKGCGFQQWCDEPRSAQMAARIVADDRDIPAATLSQKPAPCPIHACEAVLRTAGPASKEPGAQFWVCPHRGTKGTSEDCGVFKWLGAGTSASTSSAAPTGPGQVCFKCNRPGHFASACAEGGGDAGAISGKKRSRENMSSLDGPKESRKPRRCTVCKQEGHTKAKCPHNIERQFRGGGDDEED